MTDATPALAAKAAAALEIARDEQRLQVTSERIRMRALAAGNGKSKRVATIAWEHK